MTTNEMITRRDEITLKMEVEGNYKYWENNEVVKLQAKIDKEFEKLTGLKA